MTDQPKWTPGPWALKIRSGTGESTANEVIAEIEQADPEGGYRGDIARLQSAKHIDGIADEELIANACLLFAAPDMYAALEKMGSYFPHSIVECRGDKCREPWCASCYGEEEAEEAMARVAADIAAYRAALAKARGQA